MSSKIIDLDLDLGYCEACGNFVTVIEVDGDLFCKGDYETYPDLAEPIR